MRALDSALALGRAASVPVKVVWKLNTELYCPLNELFEPIPGIESVDDRVETSMPLSTVAIEHSRKMAKRLKPLVSFVKKMRQVRSAVRNSGSKVRFLERPDTLFYADKPDALVRLATEYDLVIDTHERFFRDDEDYRGFRPTAEIRKRVEGYSLTEGNVIGVHIRRGDSKPSWIYSPTRSYIESMRSKCEADPSTRFFVASDSAEAEDVLEREFPGRIIRQPKKSYARDDPEGIKHAMVDLYCFASCRYFIGSYWSSFTDAAIEIGKMPCEIVYSQPR
jgi:hypothetical protein